MISRPCPICRTGKIWRQEQRTCSWICSRTWRTMTPQAHAIAIEQSFDTYEPHKPSPLAPNKPIIPGPDDLEDEESLTPPWLKE